MTERLHERLEGMARRLKDLGADDVLPAEHVRRIAAAIARELEGIVYELEAAPTVALHDFDPLAPADETVPRRAPATRQLARRERDG